MNGTLYVVATPIGNLEDITYRAVRILQSVDLIACEDTRQSRKLLDHYGISKPVVSYHEHNEEARSHELLRTLEGGQSVAIISDAGTPLIADPGYRIVHQARERGIPVVPVPGASAILAALSASGLPTHEFAFLGFLPAKAGQRRKALEAARELSMTVVFYETPHRIAESLSDIAEVFDETPLVIAREVTKLHEEFLSGQASQLRGEVKDRGEFTLVLGPYQAPASGPEEPVTTEVAALVASGVPRMDALKQVARRRGLSKREVYRLVEES